MFRLYSFVNGKFWPIFVGHLIHATIGPIFLTCSNMIVNSWFADNERALASGLQIMSGAIGFAGCFALQAVWLNKDIGMRDFLWNMIVAQNIVFLVAVLLLFFVFRDKPLHPPSPVAEAKPQPLNVCEILQELKINKNFRYLLLAFSIVQGTMNSFGLVLSDLFTPFGYSAGFLALCGIIFLVSGIVGTIVFSILADRTSKLKCIQVMLPVLTMTALGGIALFITDMVSVRLGASLILIAFAGQAFLSLSLNFAAELTFPK